MFDPFSGSAGKASAWLDLFERPAAPEHEDLSWARAAAADRLDPVEQRRLDAITRDFLASRQGLPAPDLAEIDWALALLADLAAARSENGPDEAALGRLEDITARLLLSAQAWLEQALAALPPALSAPSASERRWANERIQAAQQGQPLSGRDQERLLRLIKASRDADRFNG